MMNPMELMKNAGAISQIGKQVTEFLAWAKAALEAIIRNQHDLNSRMKKIENELQSLTTVIGEANAFAVIERMKIRDSGNENGIRDRTGFDDKPCDGREHGNGEGDPHSHGARA